MPRFTQLQNLPSALNLSVTDTATTVGAFYLNWTASKSPSINELGEFITLISQCIQPIKDALNPIRFEDKVITKTCVGVKSGSTTYFEQISHGLGLTHPSILLLTEMLVMFTSYL